MDTDSDWVSLDDWKPTEKKKVFRIPSRWRMEANRNYVESHVGLDDLRKIKAHIKSLVPKHEVMRVFNISSYTYKLILRGKYIAWGNSYNIPSERQEMDIQTEMKERHQELMEDIMIDFNISEATFRSLYLDMLGVKKKKKQKKADIDFDVDLEEGDEDERPIEIA